MADARLHVTDARGRRVVLLDAPRFTIGRRSARDLQLISTDAWREHAEITRIDGRYVVRDRGSRHGTYVTDEQVTERALVHGDRIRLGRTDAVEVVLLTDDSAPFLSDSSSVTDLRQMAARRCSACSRTRRIRQGPFSSSPAIWSSCAAMGRPRRGTRATRNSGATA